jgi:hypothetical protein
MMEAEIGAASAMSLTRAGNRRRRVRAGAGELLPDQRSAVTNGKRLHVEGPGTSAWARRFRDVLAEITSDVQSHTNAGLSEGQRQLARRCATLCIECEKLEGEAAAGREIDVDRYGVMTDRLGRAFQRLGLKRQARTVSSFSDAWCDDVKQRQAPEPEAPHG